MFRFNVMVCAGYLISLKVPELALAVELCIKGLLQAFTCDNHNDERVLKGIMSKVFQGGQRPQIITSPFLPNCHDTRKRWVRVALKLTFPVSANTHKPRCHFNSSSFTWFLLDLFLYGRAVNHPDYQSVLQVLEIEDPVVANCLIDLRGIESILLFMVLSPRCISTLTSTWNVNLSRNHFLSRRIVQRLGEWCRVPTLLETVLVPIQGREIRSSLTAITLLSRPDPASSPGT